MFSCKCLRTPILKNICKWLLLLEVYLRHCQISKYTSWVIRKICCNLRFPLTLRKASMIPWRETGYSFRKNADAAIGRYFAEFVLKIFTRLKKKYLRWNRFFESLKFKKRSSSKFVGRPFLQNASQHLFLEIAFIKESYKKQTFRWASSITLSSFSVFRHF